MVEKDVLSQEEIDALLDSVDGNEEQSAGDAPAVDSGAEQPSAEMQGNEDEAGEIIEGLGVVKPLNFTGQQRIVRGQLPVLDKIYDRAVKLFSHDIYQLTAKDFVIKQDQLLVTKHRDFMKGVNNPSLITVYKFKPLRGKGIIVFDSPFIYDLVDYYFGGTSRFPFQKDKTDFTAIELQVMSMVTEKLCNDLKSAWEHVVSLEITKVNEETNPQLISIAEPDEMLLVARFSIDFGKETGAFHIVLPYSMLEPIKQQLELGAARPDDELDPNWINSLREEMMDVELTVSASLANAEDSLGSVVSWQAGDFIPMELQEIVTLDIEGTPGFTATLGSVADKRALKIIDIIRYRG